MPYICLANATIPDGTIQILDVAPNASQRHPAYDPPAQTRYVNRVENDVVVVDTNGAIGATVANGLGAYLTDKVEPGGLEQATATITCVGVQVGDTVTIKGIVFTAQAAQNIALRQFDQSGGDNATATSLRAVLNDDDNQDLVRVAAGQPAAHLNVWADADVPIANALTIRARFDANAVSVGADDIVQLGPNGSIALATSNAARLVVTTPVTGVITRLARTNETWNGNLANATAALIARVDAGSTMQLADIDTVLNAFGGAELTSLATSNSVGVVTELLSILSGRGYRIQRLNAAGTAVNQYMTAANPTYEWNSALLGGFTTAVTVNGLQMTSGEIGPAAIGGDTENRETKGITDTYDSTSLRVSQNVGALATLRAAAGQTAITLWPDSDPVPHFPWDSQGTLTFPAVAGARVVTVYDDDGTILS